MDLATVARGRTARVRTVALRVTIGLAVGAVLVLTFLRLVGAGAVYQRLIHINLGIALLCGVDVSRRLCRSGDAMAVPADTQPGERPPGRCHLSDRHLSQLAAADPRRRDRDELAVAALGRDPRQ